MSDWDVLIVEDDQALCEALRETLTLSGWRVATAADGVEALACLERGPVRLVISDIKMARMDGRALLENIRRRWPDLPVLLMTAYGTIEQAVEVIRAGANDYLVKPFEAAVLVEQVKRYLALATHAHQEAVKSPAMRRVYELAQRVAPTDASVLILGESGSGKEVIARYLHRHSRRSRGPFLAINCAAIPEQMLEAELFGYEKGAFTGAIQATPGKFELAQGGTLLLDEISEMAPSLQVKLLRVLQEREVMRLGGRRTLKLDVRILATSNRNLREEVNAGRFREDLFYRVNVFPLSLPPLRERREDIPALAQALLARHAGGKSLPQLNAAALAKLQHYHWPGNVRELENVIQRALILAGGGEIGPEALVFDDGEVLTPLPPASDSRPARLDEGLRSMEEQIILETLKQENGSRASTAKRLGISPRTLRYKLAKMREAGIPLPC
ncbi:two-component system, response regulator FlrC [Methylomarinovum tepidoasis]|uniref:Two-component system, response regulator FlrC n=1 Tax=Methylomarinovum tepidoasis TaxID=2840183 RepID=A0AAU9CU56_9GAMM|nr:sigma-54 dependent transcriptional regulator [Methylomarinovum sp. IN45]BCX88165.1 two-component system, response regulator FlrC [Methylomarinovum sp. IN45]